MIRKELPAFFSQTGFAPVILLALVMFGIAAGTILVQNGVNFLPKAANDEQEVLKPVDPKKLEECDGKEDAEQVQKCKDSVCADDEVTYCDNRGDKPKAIRKTGGYYDPQHPLHDGSGCVFDFFEVSDKNDQCSKAESKNGDVVYTTKGEGDQIDSGRKNSQKDREKADKCASKVECRKNGDKLEAWRIISTFDEESNRCIGAKIESGRLVSDNTVEKFEFNDAGRDADCKLKKDKDVIEQSNSDSPKDSKDLASSSDRGRFGVDTDNQTKTLLSNFESTRAKIQSNTTLNAQQKKKLLDKIDKADKALQNAKSYIDKCIQTGAQADCGAALSAQIYAVALSREALAEVVEAGIEGTKENPIRVKTDLQIGQNNNSQITAKPANGVPGFGRVFARAEGGKIYFEVRGDDGKFYLADPADLKSAGLTQGMSLDDYQKWLKGRLETVRQTTKTEPVLPTAPAQAPVAPGNKSGSGVEGVPAPVVGVNYIRRPIDNSKCDASCKKEEGKQCREIVHTDKSVKYNCGLTSYSGFIAENPIVERVDNSFCSGQCDSNNLCTLGVNSEKGYYYTCVSKEAGSDLSNNNFCVKPEDCKSGFCTNDGKGNLRCSETPSLIAPAGIDVWEPVSIEICYQKCGDSFPRAPEGRCFFNQARNLYNCSRDINAYCEANNWCNSEYCNPATKSCQTKPTTPGPANQEFISMSSLTIKEPANDTECNREGVQCKFFTSREKNDGIIIYRGKWNVILSLLPPDATKQREITIEVLPTGSLKTAADLENFLRSLDASVYEDITNELVNYNLDGGIIRIQKKVGF